MGHIFISYSHKDKEYVHKLADAMQSEGFEVWIDDRIDYGTRWPLVIETAIDTCDAFILIASDNSRTSEWVQHEFVRAQRLRKPLYPVLISGNPWISFESTQYFDARDGSLPALKFYAALRNNLNKHLEVIREMLLGSWPIYTNREHKFSVSYPVDGNIKFEKGKVVQIDLPVLRGTELKEKSIMFHINEDGILSSPLNNDQTLYKPSNVEILGQRFLRENGFDGAAGTSYVWTSYSIAREKKVVTASILLATNSYRLFFPKLLPRIDLVAEAETLIYILSTFTWLD